MNTRPYEIRWHGRGGQGAITASKIVAEAAYLEGYQGVTATPSFGSERRGMPVSASTRISLQPVMACDLSFSNMGCRSTSLFTLYPMITFIITLSFPFWP